MPGSRNLEHYDSALFGYTVASIVAFGAIVFRYAIWLQRPATRVYWRRGWKLYLQREKFAQNTANAAKTIATNLVGQRFIFKRGFSRWAMHFLIMWGCVLSLITSLKPRCLDCRNCVNACPFGVPKYNTEIHLQMKCDMCYDRSSEGLKPMCESVCPTGAISFGKYEQIVPLRRTKPVNVHVFGNQKVETKVYLMLPTDADEVKVDGCGVFEGMLTRAETDTESWIDTQVEHSDKANEF